MFKTNRLALLLAIFALTSFTSSSSAQVTGFSLVKPSGTPGALLVLPGSARRIELNCASGCSTSNTAKWSVSSSSGGASATVTPSPTGNYADVNLGAGAGTCPVTGPSSAYTVSASATVTVTATSMDDPSKSDSVIMDVCSPAVEAYTVPFYRVLYPGQREDVQGVIWGSSNTGGTWQLISQPANGDAVLDDTRFNDTVFHATVPGLYKVRWTSAADGSKSSYSTFYVTGNQQPRLSQPNGTEPVDCTADPNTTGGTLNVGPTQTYKNLEAIAPGAIVPGVTIRLHNEDTTGSNPTTYHEWIQINNAGTHDNPIRLCGVPDSYGNLPVMDGTNATARGDILSIPYVSGLAGIMVYSTNYDPYPAYNGPQYVIVEGIALRNYSPTHTYSPAGTTGGATAYINGSSGFRFQDCRDCELNGAEVSFNGNGVFTESNDSRAWGGVSERLLFEGNNVHDNGVTGDNHEHNWYLQGWFQVVQFNQMPTYNTSAQGSQYKDRGISWFRYNLVGKGAQRDLDLVEVQDAPHYLDPNAYLTSMRVVEPRDQYTGDQLAAAQEVWHHSEHVYGNLFEQAEANSVHFSGDSSGGYVLRTGTLDFFNNTVNIGSPAGVWRYSWFDTGDNGDNLPHYEWPSINVANTVMVGFSNTGAPYFSWNSQRDSFLNFDNILVSPSWGTNVQTCTNNATGACDGTGWAYGSNTDVYFNGNQFNATGVGTFVSASSVNPLVANSYQLAAPVAGRPLSGSQSLLPVRFQYVMNGGYVLPRSVVVTDTTGGTIGATDGSVSAPAPPPPVPASALSISLAPATLSLAAQAQATLTCTTHLSDGSSRACLSPVLSSSNPASATVSGLVVTASATAGTGTISVSAEGFKSSASFSVAAAPATKPPTTTPPTVVSIVISPASLSIPAGAQASLACTATLSNKTSRACNNPILTSSNMGSATVAGLVVSATRTQGSGTITALAEGFSAHASFSVTAAPAPTPAPVPQPVAVVSLQLTPTANYLKAGGSTTVYCTAKLSNGVKRACLGPFVSISNPALASLSGTRITAKSVQGTAVLTVQAEGKAATAMLYVTGSSAVSKIASNAGVRK